MIDQSKDSTLIHLGGPSFMGLLMDARVTYRNVGDYKSAVLWQSTRIIQVETCHGLSLNPTSYASQHFPRSLISGKGKKEETEIPYER